MARTKSTYNALGDKATAPAEKYRVGAYVRLSKDDGEKGESLSVTNQKGIIEDFIQSNSDEFELTEVYIDDGISGITDERPSFQRMLADCKKKKINCVIVKDPSRFGRNYSDVEHYVDEVFRAYGIRFISLDNPRVDSLLDPGSVTGMQFHFSNYFNQYFVAQTSAKINQTFQHRMKSGINISSWGTFGYNKVREDKDTVYFVINEEEAKVVRMIFDLFINQSYTMTRIAHHLNKIGIPSLLEWRKIKDPNFVNTSKKIATQGWNYNAVKGVIKDERYLGHTIQGMTKKPSYKSNRKVRLPKEEWYYNYNTHEPIIDEETFAQAQKLSERPSRSSPRTGEKPMYSGLIFCAKCGSTLNRKSSGRRKKDGTITKGYSCMFAIRTGNCEPLHIAEGTLNEAVLSAIRVQIHMITDMSALFEAIKQKKGTVNTKSIYQKSIKSFEDELQKLQQRSHRIYIRYDDGEIPLDLFQSMLKALEDEKVVLQEKIKKATREMKKHELSNKGDKLISDYVQNFKTHENITEITRELLLALVDKVLVKKKDGETVRKLPAKEVTVVFKFQDQFELLKKFNEENADIPV